MGDKSLKGEHTVELHYKGEDRSEAWQWNEGNLIPSSYAEQNDESEARSKENDKGIEEEATNIPYDSNEHLTYKST